MRGASTLGWVLMWGLSGAPLPADAVALEVQVSGVQGEEEKNVLALLTIFHERQDPTLTEARLLALHRRAPRQIATALEPFGYYRVRIEDQLLPPADEQSPWVARYQIDRGTPVRIGTVNYRLSGPGAADPAFPAQLPLRPGDVLLHAVYTAAREQLTAIAAQRGYLDATWRRREVLIDLDSYTAEIDLHLDTGPQYYLGAVQFEQDLLDEALLRRLVPFTVGEIYDPARLLELQSRLLSTEYYSQVEIVPLRAQADARRIVPIQVRAQPNLANRYRIGLGLATDVGPRLTLDYRRRYLNRHGHRFKAELALSPRTQTLNAEYRVPIRRPERDYLLIHPEFQAYDTDTRQGTVYKLQIAYSHGAARRWRQTIGIDYRYEDYTLSAKTRDYFNGLVPYVALSTLVADDPINPREGYRIKFLFQGTSTALLAPSHWLSAEANVKWIYGLDTAWRLLTRADLGAIWATSLAAVPGSQRFFAGGDNSVRGWDFEVLGPDDPVTGKNSGGRYLAVGSLELERRLTAGLSAALFTDFGNAFDPDRPAKWQQSLGLGVRYRTPLGPIRLDLAYALTKEKPGARLHLAIGPEL